MREGSIKHFNIRVYGIFLNEKDEVLLSDEYVLDTYMTKFPGGGLLFGEGPEDCIKREIKEELGEDTDIISHLYTTGFFQKTIFYNDHQLISIYYKLRFTKKPKFRISEKSFDFEGENNGSQSFRWISVKELKEEELTFPVDRHVLTILKKELEILPGVH